MGRLQAGTHWAKVQASYLQHIASTYVHTQLVYVERLLMTTGLKDKAGTWANSYEDNDARLKHTHGKITEYITLLAQTLHNKNKPCYIPKNLSRSTRDRRGTEQGHEAPGETSFHLPRGSGNVGNGLWVCIPSNSRL